MGTGRPGCWEWVDVPDPEADVDTTGGEPGAFGAQCLELGWAETHNDYVRLGVTVDFWVGQDPVRSGIAMGKGPAREPDDMLEHLTSAGGKGDGVSPRRFGQPEAISKESGDDDPWRHRATLGGERAIESGFGRKQLGMLRGKSVRGCPTRLPLSEVGEASVARVLIVGGAGYVGGWLTDQAVAAGHDVRVYDLLLYEDSYLKPVPFVNGDILDRERLAPHVAWADIVVWLAALVGDGACSFDDHLTWKINVESVGWLASVFDGRIVFMSTCSVYGAQDGELTETSPTNPLSAYARSKLEAEALLTDKDALIFRLGTLHGVGDTYSRLRLDLVVNVLTLKAVLNGRMSVFGGAQYRPLLHVRDVGNAAVAGMVGPERGIFNLHAENYTIFEIAEEVQKQVPDAAVEVTEMKFQDSRNYRVLSKKAEDLLGFSPEYDLPSGIAQVRELVEERRIIDLTDSRFSNFDFLRPFLRPDTSPLGKEIHLPHQLSRHRTLT
jgi:nucleoside-diphosphate-sugar epimerase